MRNQVNIQDTIKMMDEKWVSENPKTASDMIQILFEDKQRTKDYVKFLEEKLEEQKEMNMMLSSIIESYKKEEIPNYQDPDGDEIIISDWS